MINAVYSSTVFEGNRDFFESISIDLKVEGERTGFAIVLFRQMEKQCFNYDSNDKFMATPDEWRYFEEKRHELHQITRSQITKRLNEITTWAVQKFDVNDVGNMNHHCVTMRNETGTPFHTEHTFHVLQNDEMASFETVLCASFGREKACRILNFFRKHFRDLPKSTIQEIEPEQSIKKAERAPVYIAWGDWS